MSGSIEVSYLQQQSDKMLELELSQLKKMAQQNGLQDDAIEAAISKPAKNEDDTKAHVIALIFQATCLKASASPMGRKKMQLGEAAVREATDLQTDAKQKMGLEASQPESGEPTYVQKQTEKMMELKVSQLKKLAKKNGIPEEVIKAAVATPVDDENDTKGLLIRLLFKAACLKASPCPDKSPVQDEDDMFCTVCVGCIRPPFHEGPCCDGQLNELVPVSSEQERMDVGIVADELAQHKAMKESVSKKVEEEVRQKAAVEAEKQIRRKAAEEQARNKLALEEEARQKAAKEHAQQLAALEEEARQKAAQEEAEEARKKAALEEIWRRAAEEEAKQNAAQKEEGRAITVEEEARKQAAEEKARRRAEQEEAEIAEMDQRCVDIFLLCCNESRVRTPVKGTILYTKFMRPLRPAGTSVDVKDSSFHGLGNFLKFLEGEGLLRLKPGETDPVVTEIRRDACRNYRYVAAPRSAAVNMASHIAAGNTVGARPNLNLSWQ